MNFKISLFSRAGRNVHVMGIKAVGVAALHQDFVFCS